MKPTDVNLDLSTKESSPSEPATLGFFAALKAVAWSFIGLRSSSGNRQDLSRVSPISLIVAGLCLVALMVGSLITLVRFVLP